MFMICSIVCLALRRVKGGYSSSWPGLSRPSMSLNSLRKSWMPGMGLHSGRPKAGTRVAGHDVHSAGAQGRHLDLDLEFSPGEARDDHQRGGEGIAGHV